MRKYRVVVEGTLGTRTFQIFDDKQKAMEQAKICFECGLDNVYVTYGNYNHVPNTPIYKRGE